jgi:HEPN domain-containing protein
MMAPRRQAQTRPASTADARAYFSKAREFLRASTDSLELGNHIAATGNAVHAAIGAADTITAARAGAVWKGEHSQAPAYLEKAAGVDGRQAARHLRRLLPLKSQAEYDPNPIPHADAAAAVEAARRIVAIAEQVLRSISS